jgi:hypothetical protein
MTLITGRGPRRAGGTNAAGRIRSRIFCLVKDLGMDEETRRQVAAQCRMDKQPTMAGMKGDELREMERLLSAQVREYRRKSRAVEESVRAARLAKHKRVDGQEASPHASERAVHYLRDQAMILWGDGWEAELQKFTAEEIRKRGGKSDVWLPWYSLRWPKKLHHDITEAVLAQIRRAARDQSTHGDRAEINRRRRMRDER